MKINEKRILDLFRKDLFYSGTISDISAKLRKPYPKVHEAVKSLEKLGIIVEEKVGNSMLCRIALSSRTIASLSYLESESLKNIPSMEKILELEEFMDDILLVTGSYANNKQSKHSDIDLVIITKDNAFKKQKLMENLTLTFKPEIHALAVSYKDFIEMLKSKEGNLGKEVFRNRLIFRNAERYYLLLKEAINNGFTSKDLH